MKFSCLWERDHADSASSFGSNVLELSGRSIQSSRMAASFAAFSPQRVESFAASLEVIELRLLILRADPTNPEISSN